MKRIPPKFHFLVLQFLIVFGLPAQNLVPNYSFETYSSCPNDLNQLYLLSDWYSPTYGTSDFYHTCAPIGSNIAIPDNYTGYQETLTGEGYTGLVIYQGGGSLWREYLQAALTEPLIAGECYELELFSSLAEGSNWGTNGVGIYLSDTPPPTSGNGNINLTPQLYYPDVILDTENWVPLSGVYTAVGGEQYITIGLFFEPGSFDVEPLIPPGGVENLAYYYIEDVRVEHIISEEDVEGVICQGECFEYEGEQYCEEGVYEIPVQGACISSVYVTVILEESAVASIMPPEILDCNLNSIILDGSGSSSGPGIDYQWSGPNNFNSSAQSPEVFEPGIYTLIVEGDNLCPAEVSIEVEEDVTPPDISTEVSGNIDCNNSMVFLTGTSSTPNTTYHWNGPGVDVDESVAITNQPGTFTLTVTGENGCTSTEEVTVIEDLEPPNISAQVLGVLDCNTPSVVLQGSSTTPNVTYLWSGPGVDSNDPVTSTNQPGDYTFFVFAPSGCINAVGLTVIEEELALDIDANVDGTLNCENEIVTLTGSTTTPDVTYEWSGPNVNVDSAIVEVNQPGDYTFSIMTGSGCTADTTISVEQNIEDPEILIASPDTIDCNMVTVELDASGSTGSDTLSFEWQDLDGNTLGMDTILTINSSGSYALILTNEDNGCMAIDTVTVNEDVEAPNPDATSSGLIDCTNTLVTLDGSNSSGNGNLNFEWLDENDTTFGMDPTVDVDTSGIYTLVITDDSNGCTATTTIEVGEDIETPNPDATSSGLIDCINAEVTLDGSGSNGGGIITYQWQAPGGIDLGTDAQQIVNTTGIYTLIITNNSNGCTAQTTVEVFDDFAMPYADAGTDASLTCDETSVILDGSGSDSGSNITYEWFDPLNSSLGDVIIIDVNNPGTYTLVVTNEDNGCSSASTVFVEQDIEAPIADAGNPQTLTCIETEVTLSGNGSGGTNLSFEWLDPSDAPIGITPDINVNQTGEYTFIVTNNENGCTATALVNVLEDIDSPTADGGVDDLLNCVISEVTLDGNNSSGSANLSFQWLNSNNDVIGGNATINISNSGVYTLVVTNDDNGCSSTDVVQVNEDYDAPQAVGSPESQLTCINNEVVISGLGSTGNGNLAYEWFDQNNISLGTAIDLTVSNPATYILIVTDESNGCTASTDVTVLQDINLPSADAGANATLTCNVTEVILSGSGSTNSGNINYEWQNSGGLVLGNSASVTVSQTDTYTLIITDPDNGCSASSDVEVSPDANLPIADAGSSNTLTCIDTEALLDGTASSSGVNYSYEWQDTNGDQIDNTQSTTVSLPGVYTIIVTDNDNGCTSSAFVEIVENVEIPVADAGLSPTLTCDMTTATLDASASSISSGSLSFEWTDPGGIIIGNNNTVVVDAIGIYNLLVTAENGCTSTAQVEVFLDANVPIADTGAGGILDCETTSIILGGTGTSSGLNISYEWLNEDNLVIATTATTAITIPGTYLLNVYNSDNNCETSAFIEITQDIEAPQADAGPGGILSCTNTIIEIGGSGTSTGINYSYEWFDSNNSSLGTSTTLDIDLPDTYTLIVTNTENHCSAEASVTIGQDIDVPVADAGQGGILSCDVTEITLDGSNSTGTNLTYQWQDENGNIIDNESVTQVSQVGNYTLMVTNTTNGCTAVSSVSVTPDANLPTAIASNDGILNCVNSSVLMDGSASSSISGNTGFQWFDASGNLLSIADNYNTSIPGTYVLIVTDLNNGCTASSTEIVGQDIADPMAEAGPDQLLSCDVAETTLTGTGSGGNNLSYQWLDENGTILSNTSSVLVDIIGTYTFMVTNNDNGCTASSELVVNPDTNLPTADAGTAETLSCTLLDITLDGSASSSGPTIDYEWQDGLGTTISNSVSVTITQPGTYTLIITDNSNGCSAQDDIIVLQDINPPTAIIDESSPLSIDCNHASFVLDGNGSFPNGSLTYLWTTVDGNILSDEDTPNPEVDAAGTYTLMVTNLSNGCTHTASITIIEDLNDPVAIINNPDLLTCTFIEITLDGSGSSSNGDFTYSWSSVPAGGVIANENTLQPTINQSGIYTLTVLNNENGCETETEIFVDQDVTLPQALTSVDDELDCVTESVTLDGSGSSTGAEFIYNWTGNGIIENASSLSPTVYQSGIFTLQVTNQNNGCTNSADINVNENTNIPSALNYQMLPPDCFGDAGSIDILEVIDGVGPYLYSINGGVDFSSLNFFDPLEPGNYSIIVQDAAGCEYEELISIPAVIELDVNVGPDDILELGEAYQLIAQPNIPADQIDTIIWSPSEGLSCTDCLDPVANIYFETMYTVTIINLNGCIVSDDILLRVRKERNIFIPNVFSPHNNDGINDIFMIFAGNDKVKEIHTFRIFDRWGEVVFENYNFQPNNPDQGWNGLFHNEILNPAVFVYFAEIEFIDGHTELFKGDVTLKR